MHMLGALPGWHSVRHEHDDRRQAGNNERIRRVGEGFAFALRGSGACALTTEIDPVCTLPYESAAIGELSLKILGL
eukprot:12063562-Heterocapsa_arctica.AAC.1